MSMKLEDMVAFAALTDEERTMAIRREKARLKAIEEYASEPFQPDQYDAELPDCGCGNPYWSLDKEGQAELNICFDSDGTIGSDMWELTRMENLYCLHCKGKPMPSQSYIDDFIEAEVNA